MSFRYSRTGQWSPATVRSATNQTGMAPSTFAALIAIDHAFRGDRRDEYAAAHAAIARVVVRVVVRPAS